MIVENPLFFLKYSSNVAPLTDEYLDKEISSTHPFSFLFSYLSFHCVPSKGEKPQGFKNMFILYSYRVVILQRKHHATNTCTQIPKLTQKITRITEITKDSNGNTNYHHSYPACFLNVWVWVCVRENVNGNCCIEREGANAWLAEPETKNYSCFALYCGYVCGCAKRYYNHFNKCFFSFFPSTAKMKKKIWQNGNSFCCCLLF